MRSPGSDRCHRGKRSQQQPSTPEKWYYRFIGGRSSADRKLKTPAVMVRPNSIARFEPRDRALSPAEIGLMYRYMDRIGTSPQYRAAIKLLLLTMVQKIRAVQRHLGRRSNFGRGRFLDDPEKQRMKRRNPHLVFLSRQALDIYRTEDLCRWF